MKYKILKILEHDKKCKYHKECKGYENKPTCNHEKQADGYCGIRTKGEFSKDS